jgi:hypothetical protein
MMSPRNEMVSVGVKRAWLLSLALHWYLFISVSRREVWPASYMLCVHGYDIIS